VLAALLKVSRVPPTRAIAFDNVPQSAAETPAFVVTVLPGVMTDVIATTKPASLHFPSENASRRTAARALSAFAEPVG
jgi:hypothetical protein